MADEYWTAEVLDSLDRELGLMPGVKSGSLSESIFKSVRGSGTIEFNDLNEDIDWLTSRVRIRHYRGETMTPKGIWLPAIPAWGWSWPLRSASLQLLDKTEVLNRDCGMWFSVNTTTNVVGLVLSIIAGVGESAVSIADSDATLNTPLLFDPEVTWLKICNDLLTAIGHTSLVPDGEGVIVSSPYVPPDQRTLVGTYGANPGDLRMKPKFTDESNVFEVPNIVNCVVPATDTAPGLIGTARNDDPNSPLSTVNRGERPITEQIEAVSQKVADDTAARRLGDVSQVTRRITWDHPIDGTSLDDIVKLGPLNEVLALVQRETKMGVGAVVSTTGRKIYTGGNSPW